MSKRITWIDTCKGIGIFLVIIGHTTLVDAPRIHIYSFHMPLFFFLSGFLFSTKGSFREFSLIKVKTLLVPYIFFAILSFLLTTHYLGMPIEIGSFFYSTIESRRNYIFYNIPLWFLTSLFLIEIIFYYLVKLIKNKYAILMVVIPVGFLSHWQLGAARGTNILPWSLDQSLYYLVFFGIGYFVRILNWLERDLKKSFLLVVPSILYIWFVLDSTVYERAWQILHLTPNIQIYLSGILWALLAISFTIYISQFLSFSPVLSYLGRNTLILMCLHLPLAINVFNTHFREGLNLENHPNILALFITIFSILLLIPVSYIMNNLFPFLLGKKFNHKLLVYNYIFKK
ncbi:acyltransferase family protein [Neobacillus niacini]|uniref:acyltransferase family protein n=1 Tax=Neobacillus niacini TaxID=86668 RepID=UPI003B022163